VDHELATTTLITLVGNAVDNAANAAGNSGLLNNPNTASDPDLLFVAQNYVQNIYLVLRHYRTLLK